MSISLTRITASICLALVTPTILAAQTPNVVLILVDDLSFTDLGVYGSEIATPNIDALAKQGMLFSNYHASPMCSPSRAMLMTGLDSHQTGLANLPETVPEEHVGAPGYTGTLDPAATTIATRLKALGYRTYMTGKWHLGHTAESLPSARGFERTFILDATGGDNWEKRAYMPVYETAEWFEDGKPTDLPADFYSSDFLVDRMIDYIDSDRTAPFFSYVSFLAVHIPVQAPRKFVDRYRGRYDQGWEVLRNRRHRGAVEKGVFPKDAKVGPMLDHLRKWDSLDAEQQALLAARMEVYAGMVEAMDYNVGRLVNHLKETGRYENTVFIVTSDNGPEAGDPFAMSPTMHLWFQAMGYQLSGEQLGERGTWAFIGPEFASASAGPLAFFKFHAGEGGVRVPMVLSGPGFAVGQNNSFSFITDIVPTILELAGGSPHDDPSLIGRSLVPVVRGQSNQIHDADSAIGFETGGQSGLYRGQYKLVRNWLPHGDKVWRLYNLETDPGETQDLAATDPALFESMMADYTRYASRHGVLAVAEDYDPIMNLQERTFRTVASRYAQTLGVALGLAVLIVATLVIVRRRKRKKSHASQ